MNNQHYTSTQYLPLKKREQKRLRKQKNEQLRLFIIFVVLTPVFFYIFYHLYINQNKAIEILVVVLILLILWIFILIFMYKLYADAAYDVKTNVKIHIEGVIEKISHSIGENGGNTFIFLKGKKYTIPKEAYLEGGFVYDFIQQGDKVILSIAPRSKYLLNVKRITQNIDNEFTNE